MLMMRYRLNARFRPLNQVRAETLQENSFL